MLLAQLKRNFEFRSDAGVEKLAKLPSAIDSRSNNTLGSDSFQNIRILQVDDDAGLLTTTKQILELQNPFYVEIASSVREALEKLEKLSFDVVVSDYQMPEKDGLTFLKELRELGCTIPFILFTGKGREEVAIKALNLGADYYINKLGHPETVYPQLSHYILQAVKKRKAEEKLKYKVVLESVVTRISSRFVNPTDFDAAINKSLADIGRVSRASRASLFLLSEDGNFLKNSHEWCNQGVDPQIQQLQNFPCEMYPCWMEKLHEGETIHVSDVSLMKFEVESEQKVLERFGIKSILLLPVNVSGKLGGFIGFVNLTTTGFWGSEDVSLLRLVSELIGTSLERKKAYENLAENEKTYRLLAENISDVIFIQSMNLNVTYITPSIKTLAGYTPEEVYQIKATDFMTPESFERGVVDFKEALLLVTEHPGSEIPLKVYEYIRKDGTTFWGELKTKILFNSEGNPIGLQGVLRDVTNRKKIEEKLKAREEQYRLLTENTTDVIFIQNQDMSIRYVSPSVEALSGYTPEEVINLGPIGLMTPESFELGLVEIQADLKKSAQDPNFEPAFRSYEYIKKDGSTGWGEFKPKLLRDSEGNIVAMQGTLRDVTERKKAEDALRQEQEKLEKITGTLKVGLSLISKDFKILWANKFLTDICGDVIGKTCYSVYNDLGTICPNCGVKEIFETGKDHVTCEQSIPSANGQRLWVELTANPIRDKQGNVIAASELSVSIDERKRMANKLREAEKRYRFLFDKAPVGIFLLDLTGSIVAFNDQAYLQLGYSREEFENLCVADIEGLDSTEEQFARIKRVQATGKTEFETKHRAKTGELRDVILSVQLMDFDEKQFLYCISRDITDQKKAELQIINCEKKYREMVNAMTDIVWAVDFDGNITDVNDSAVDVLGYSRSELLNMKVKQIDLNVSNLEAEGICERIFAGFVTVFKSMYTTKDGRKIPVEVNASPMVYDGKQGILCISRDVTERREAEESMDKIMKELLVINEKLSVVGKLTRHDVRNKLSVISNNVYLAKKQLDGNKGVFQYFDTMSSAIDQVDRIFSFAQTYEQLGDEELSNIDAKKSFDDAVSLFSGTDGITFVNGCSGLFLVADSLLRQLFYNLIDDSLKHGEKVNQIKVHSEEESDHLNLIYEDNGIGIPETEKELSFTEGYGKDTGYGLYLIRKICEAYGWTITETGKHGQGVKFVMCIPKFDQKSQQLYKIELD